MITARVNLMRFMDALYPCGTVLDSVVVLPDLVSLRILGGGSTQGLQMR